VPCRHWHSSIQLINAPASRRRVKPSTGLLDSKYLYDQPGHSSIQHTWGPLQRFKTARRVSSSPSALPAGGHKRTEMKLFWLHRLQWQFGVSILLTSKFESELIPLYSYKRHSFNHGNAPDNHQRSVSRKDKIVGESSGCRQSLTR